ncbi:MAG: ATP F0F1 synthase subunit B [Pseudomonadota bacterium]|nr:ATP F0F1 synthase subunit B [Pseudomonadota bacterium]
MESLHEAETWVAVGFVLFVALLVYLGAPRMIAKFLDERAARIARELDEAKKLREEAQALLNDAMKKRQDAGAEAEAIVRQAKMDAEAFAVEARRRFSETMERRSAGALQKIAQAEVQAIKDVRLAAADLAIGAATRILKEDLKGPKGAKLIDKNIGEIKARLQ